MMFLPTLAAGDNPLSHVVDHPIFELNGWWLLTNHMVMMALAAILMLVVFLTITRPYVDGKHVPTGTRNFFEALMIFVRDDVAKPVLGMHTTAYMPFLWTLFFFILFMNILGLLPFDQSAHLTQALGLSSAAADGSWHFDMSHGVYGTATANLMVTATLAIVSFFIIQISGIRANGLGNYLKHFLAGAPWYMAFIMVPVEILGMFIKPFALLIRLFANMTAGHVLVAVIIGFVSMAYQGLGTSGAVGIGVVVVLAGIAVMMLEVFVAFLQAYIFTMLVALFIGQLIVHEHEEGHDHHDEAHESFGGGDMMDYAKLPQDARGAGTHMAG